MNVKIKDIVKECNAKLVFGDEEIVCDNFSKDTRTLQKNDVYVGIKGENFDGNSLYEEALRKGAKVCILQGVEISDEIREKYTDRAVILVEDTIKALQQIATYKRSLYNIPVIAITGSVGKTSTKDIIASVVDKEFKVLKTQGNLNNHIGVPLTILGLKSHEALVVEMGMNNLGEISVLTNIAKPNIAVITNVGTSHIGNLGSRENILKAKLEILEGIQPYSKGIDGIENSFLQKSGVLIINNDNDLLSAWKDEYNGNVKIVTYGIENESNFMAKDIVLNEVSSTFEVVTKFESLTKGKTNGVLGNELKSVSSSIVNENTEQSDSNYDCSDRVKITVPVGGKHFVYNALSAFAVGTILGIPVSKIKEGIQKFELTKSRMELINLPNEIIIINDCYNANYDSMKSAIEYLGKTSANRKVAILGDMLELGEFSNDLHKKVGEEVIKNKIDILITVGEMGKVISETVEKQDTSVQVYHFENNELAAQKAKDIMHEDDIILIKASNGMKFKEIVQMLCEQ